MLVQDVTEFLAVLYAGELLFLTTGLMGMSGLWSFSWAFETHITLFPVRRRHSNNL